jgi:glycerol-3-phosphate O-acyltransferase
LPGCGQSGNAVPMTTTVTLPFWLFVLIVLFATVTLASHFLFPSVRWFFRRRLEKAVARLNQRLERPIQPFKLARRFDMIQRLIYDPEVARAIAEHARDTDVPEAVAFETARRYAREIVPGFSTSLYFGFAIRVTRWLSRGIYDVRLVDDQADRLRGIDPEATVVFVMNHRSNMDYFLVTWLAAERSALAYAVGEWARVWPLSWLIKSMGAYFIRRRSRNALYRRVLARYVRLATDGGVAQAMFLEDRVLINADESGERRFRARMSVVALFLGRQFWLWLRRRYRRFGRAAVSYGDPLVLSDFTAFGQGDQTDDLAAELMLRIGRAVPVVPVPLTASALLATGPVDRDGLVAEAEAQLAAMGKVGRALPDRSVRKGVDEALVILTRRRIVTDEGGMISAVPGQEAVLRYYANSLRHLLPGDAATAK